MASSARVTPSKSRKARVWGGFPKDAHAAEQAFAGHETHPYTFKLPGHPVHKPGLTDLALMLRDDRRLDRIQGTVHGGGVISEWLKVAGGEYASSGHRWSATLVEPGIAPS